MERGRASVHVGPVRPDTAGDRPQLRRQGADSPRRADRRLGAAEIRQELLGLRHPDARGDGLGLPGAQGRPGSGGLVACEGERGLGARAAAFREAKLSEDATVPDFHLVTTKLDLIGEHAILISDIAGTLGDQRPIAICIDTLNRSIRGSESNDQDMGDYVRAADAIREAFACAVVIIHHCGIEGSRPRGHTSLTGACDAQIAVKRSADKTVVTATVEHMKDGEEGDELHSTLKTIELVEDQDGNMIFSCVIEPADTPASSDNLRLRGRAGDAMGKLTDCLARHGVRAPSSDLIPNTARVVRLDQWKEFLFTTGVLKRDAANPRTDFQRIENKLRETGYIGTAENAGLLWVWSVDQVQQASCLARCSSVAPL